MCDLHWDAKSPGSKLQVCMCGGPVLQNLRTLILFGPEAQASTQQTRRSPKWVTNHQESDIISVCSAENIISMLQCTKERLWHAFGQLISFQRGWHTPVHRHE